MRPDHLFFLFVFLFAVLYVVTQRVSRRGPKMIAGILAIIAGFGLIGSVILCFLEVKKHAPFLPM